MSADLHIHTNASDGFLTPAELILKLKDSGIKTFAVTDHDAVSAIDELKRRAEFYQLNIVTGVELSAEYKNKDLHFLGYFINHHSKRFLDYLYLFKRRRYQRAQEMLDRLNKISIQISIDEVVEKTGNGPIGRPHIADCMVEKEFVTSRDEAFQKYLNDEGEVYVAKYRIGADEVIDLVHSIGGAVFIAHPGISCDTRTIKELCEMGLDGIETLHPKHPESKVKKLNSLAEELGILKCGGSDFHGDPNSVIKLGDYTIDEDSVKEIEQYCADNRSLWIVDEPEEEDLESSGSK